MKRWIRRIALGVGSLVAILLLTGSIWERVSRSSAAKDFPVAGKLVDIGGRRIQIDCRGEGSPTVVLVSGLDVGGSLSWTAVHDSIARTTRTCAYSRAGIMWSDPGPAVTSAKGVADDLHATLEKAGEHAPFVMVGHSLGGPYIMTYVKYFGDQVAGVVMVDASHPDQLERFKVIAPASADMLAMNPLKVGAALSWTGLLRFLTRSTPAMPHQDMAGVHAQGAYINNSIIGALKEADALAPTLVEAGTFRKLGARPLVVLTAMLPLSPAERTMMKLNDDGAKAFKEAWKAMHNEEASWSSRSEHILVPDASHYLQFLKPELVIRATRSVVDSVRATGHRSSE